MVDSRFFGSPTKLFEYMAMGGGIVASDLEQIGEVLSPALRANAVLHDTTGVTTERAMLCTPGSLDEFVAATLFLVRHPEIAVKLGINARNAIESEYSWARHVERLWSFIRQHDTKKQLASN
jgi:glycosyltransferase involved in cell wall biosynthesis